MVDLVQYEDLLGKAKKNVGEKWRNTYIFSMCIKFRFSKFTPNFSRVKSACEKSDFITIQVCRILSMILNILHYRLIDQQKEILTHSAKH